MTPARKNAAPATGEAPSRPGATKERNERMPQEKGKRGREKRQHMQTTHMKDTGTANPPH